MLAVLVAAATLALADDNGMTPFPGDSRAQLQARDPAAVTVPSMPGQTGTTGYTDTDAEHQPTTGRAPPLGNGKATGTHSAPSMMGGSPYGGNQDPNRPDAGATSRQGHP
jgi:hypothetical protein